MNAGNSFFIFLGSLGVFSAQAQLFSNSHFGQGSSIAGEVRCGREVAAGSLTVELVEMGRTTARSAVSCGGDFEFDSLSPGTYSVRLLDAPGHLLMERFVLVRQVTEHMELKVPESGLVPHGSKAGSTVSLNQLQHKVPPKAMKEYRDGLRALDKRNYTGGQNHLENAVEIDSDFLEAHLELGKCHLQTQEHEKALAAFERVLKIDPHSGIGHTGAGFALLKLHRFAEAEQSSRRAVEIDRSNGGSNYLVGLSLAAQEKNDDEAIQYLQRAAQQIPEARLTIVRIWARQGQLTQARTELEDYLRSGPANADSARSLLEQLKERQLTAKQ